MMSAYCIQVYKIKDLFVEKCTYYLIYFLFRPPTSVATSTTITLSASTLPTSANPSGGKHKHITT